MENKQEYVVGFLFTKDRENVLLVEKNRPEWQKEKWNGIGGKLEKKSHPLFNNYLESPREAMIREFREETGIEFEGWQLFAKLKGLDFVVHFFRGFSDLLWKYKSMADERIAEHRIEALPIFRKNYIPNLHWLIPMALNMEEERAKIFEINEFY